ncbi:hypothetical protein PGTUg99_013176 [Puccinia graminis f. sp. tritici]|uniref:Uncharacterized protein n=1 Tax=Puccinia graminis f. sp. tritici TaxID=56615 RepID=A0A5B0SHF2_PUCGR|nr:hypothetical protein PGTUg99_013176 [Puccinia graminis f. sp. tritici]
MMVEPSSEYTKTSKSCDWLLEDGVDWENLTWHHYLPLLETRERPQRAPVPEATQLR